MSSRSSKQAPGDVYPRLDGSRRQSAPRLPSTPAPPPRGSDVRVAVLIAGAVLAGGALGFYARPKLFPDRAGTQIAALERAAADARAAALDAESRLKVTAAANALLEAELDRATKGQQNVTPAAESAAATTTSAATTTGTATASASPDRDAQAKSMASLQATLTSAVDKAIGTVSSEGDEIRLQLGDKVLFNMGDAQLSKRGKLVLARVAKALAELPPDNQIWVQGHTDDVPIGTPAPRRGRRRPAPQFASNWELSAARALSVVHYFQDVAKLDPTRLAALAFGPYRPVSRSNKAANRRIEIVLYPLRSKPEPNAQK